jgi:hypothetical protein
MKEENLLCKLRFDPMSPCLRVQYATTELKGLMTCQYYLRYFKNLRTRDLYSLKL